MNLPGPALMEPPELQALTAEGAPDAPPLAVDSVAVARLYGEPLFKLPQDLYIPPDALRLFLEAFEGPLDQEAQDLLDLAQAAQGIGQFLFAGLPVAC